MDLEALHQASGRKVIGENGGLARHKHFLDVVRVDGHREVVED